MNEQISALVDGELHVQESMNEVTLMLSDKASMQAWYDFQLIGDAMRGSPNLCSDFTQRIMQAIELEPTVLAPNAMPRHEQQNSLNSNLSTTQKALDRIPTSWSIAASCAAVLMVGWVLLNQQMGDFTSGNGIQIANLTTQPIAAVELMSSKNNQITAKTNANEREVPAAPLEYLEAHQVSAPSVGSYYIQTASYSE